MKAWRSLAGAFLLSQCVGASGIALAPGGTISESFEIGTSATATLPSDWRVDKSTTVRLVGSYASAATATERSGGDSMSSSAGNGIYNFGAGAAESATDRAVGFLSSSSATKSGNLYVRLDNTGGSAITNLTVSYSVEKYRMGTNEAGFSVQLYYSTDGLVWTIAGADFLTQFAADATTAGYASAPGAVVTVADKTLPVTVAPGGVVYLAWNYSVTTGTYTSFAQALGIDDVSIAANAGSSSLPAPTGLASSSVTAGGFTAGWNGVTGAEGYELSVFTIETTGEWPDLQEEFVAVSGWESAPVDGTSCAVTGLVAKTTYYWSVVAMAGATSSDPSDIAEVTTLATVGTVDPPAILSLAPAPGGGVSATCTSQSGATYALQWRASLSLPPDWQTVAGSSEFGTGSTLTLTDSTDRGSACFYRVVATP